MISYGFEKGVCDINKENICKRIKEYCNMNSININYDDIEINISVENIDMYWRNQCVLVDKLSLISKKDKYCFYTCVGTHNIDDDTIAKYAINGFLHEKNIYEKRKNEEKIENEYKKEHPILGFLKYDFF